MGLDTSATPYILYKRSQRAVPYRDRYRSMRGLLSTAKIKLPQNIIFFGLLFSLVTSIIKIIKFYHIPLCERSLKIAFIKEIQEDQQFRHFLLECNLHILRVNHVVCIRKRRQVAALFFIFLRHNQVQDVGFDSDVSEEAILQQQ